MYDYPSIFCITSTGSKLFDHLRVPCNATENIISAAQILGP